MGKPARLMQSKSGCYEAWTTVSAKLPEFVSDLPDVPPTKNIKAPCFMGKYARLMQSKSGCYEARATVSANVQT